MHFGRVGTLGGIAFWVASAFRPDLRPLLLGATFFAFSAIPYTVAVCEYPTTRDTTLIG